MGGSVPKATIVVATGKNHCSGLVPSGCLNNTGVFTIPANIPPPPQYCTTPCSELSQTQQTIHHSSPSASRSYQQHVAMTQHFGDPSTMLSHASHPHFHINPHHKHQTTSHPLQHPSNIVHQHQHAQSPCRSEHQHSPIDNTSQCTATHRLNMQPNRCCTSSCKPSNLSPHVDPRHGGAIMRSVSLGSPQCPNARSLSPTQHHLMQNQARIASSTPPPRLQRQQSRTSTPPLIGSTMHSQATDSQLAASAQLSSASYFTLPRQRSQELSPSQSMECQGHSTLRRQRSTVEQPTQHFQPHTCHSSINSPPHMISNSPQQNILPNQTHGLLHSSPNQSNVSSPSELNYIQPNPELPTAFNANCGSGVCHGSVSNPCVPATVGKVQWEGAPSGTGSDV